MWLIFLLSAFGFGLVALGLFYIGNKVINKMKKEDCQINNELKAMSKEKDDK